MISNSLRRGERLTTSCEIRSVLKSQNRVCTDGITLAWGLRKDTALSHSRFCVVIGKKAVKNAVQRNRLRRIAKEFFRLHKNKLRFSIDVVAQISDCNLFGDKELSELLKVIFKKARLICD
ncbi:MAG: ribonuclease P protein component [Candidatus Omnitrophica bacterium]|nr:ribonuclease P protein component [Candidatus Omnitrophota bacterium]